MSTESGDDRRAAATDCYLAVSCPELTPKEQAAMDLIPDDAVEHWMRGEKMDFRLREWQAESWDSPRPEEYEFESASGFGGVNNVEIYRCPTCSCHVRFAR